jgi:hypothetical protein
MSWYRDPILRTTSGWIIPLERMDWASSSSAASANRVRGWYGLGSIKSMSICSDPPAVIGAGAAAVAAADVAAGIP